MLKKLIGKIWRKLTPTLRLKLTRATQAKFTASVAAIITNEAGEVLLLDHVLRPGASWGIPGGFLDYNEQPIEAVRRELQEETGIELIDVELFSVRVINRHIEILFRAKTKDEATVKSFEIKSVGWFRHDNLPENLSRSHRAMLEKILKNGL